MVRGYCNFRALTSPTRLAFTSSFGSSNHNTAQHATPPSTLTRAAAGTYSILVSSMQSCRFSSALTRRPHAEKISSMVRSISVNDARAAAAPTPTPAAPSWEDHAARPASRGSSARQGPVQAPSRGSLREGASDRFSPRNGHMRSDSEATGMTGLTGVASSGGYPETTQSGPARRHEYDLQAMEASLGSPKAVARNPIPAPTVTVRSEFPTINRSRQQQTLTCLITVEVSDNNWRPNLDDLQAAPPIPPQQRIEESFPARPPSPARSAPRFYPYESPEVLEEMTENLRGRVDNWHGLDFSR